jgi:hypothetical protein
MPFPTRYEVKQLVYLTTRPSSYGYSDIVAELNLREVVDASLLSSQSDMKESESE